MNSQPHSLTEILNSVIETLPQAAQWRKHRLFQHWEQLVGPAIAQHASAKKIEGDTLFVAVSHPVWRQELEWASPKLIEKIQAEFPESGIRKIRFTLFSSR